MFYLVLLMIKVPREGRKYARRGFLWKGRRRDRGARLLENLLWQRKGLRLIIRIVIKLICRLKKLKSIFSRS